MTSAPSECLISASENIVTLSGENLNLSSTLMVVYCQQNSGHVKVSNFSFKSLNIQDQLEEIPVLQLALGFIDS